MRAVVIIGAVMAAHPALADPLAVYLEHVRHSPQALSLLADLDAIDARTDRAQLAFRPDLKLGWSTFVKEDSTLPNPHNVKVGQWEGSIEWTVIDWGATLAKRDQEAATVSAETAAARRKLADLVADAGQGYIDLWRADTIAAFCRQAVADMAAASASQAQRNSHDDGTAADVRIVTSERNGLATQCASARVDARAARDAASRFGDPGHVERPVLPWAPEPDADRVLPEGIEARERARAAGFAETAAERAQLPAVKVWGDFDAVVPVHYADYRAGLRVTIDVFGAAGHDLDVRAAIADKTASAAKARAVLADATGRLRALDATIRGQDDVIAAALASARSDRARLDDDHIKVDAGKAPLSDIAIGIRRLVSARSAWSSAVAVKASAILEYNKTLGRTP